MDDRKTPPQGGATAVSFREAFRYWLRLGFINFGGPAGQIAIMHRELVEERRWISETAFLRSLNFVTLLPGPEAQQLAVYIGWRLHGTMGGLVAGLCFILPGVAALLVLSWLAVAQADVTVVRGALYGVQPMVIAVVVEAVIRIGKRALRPRWLIALAIGAFLALYAIPFAIVIALAAVFGLLIQRYRPQVMDRAGTSHGGTTDIQQDVIAGCPTLARNLVIVGIFLALWAIPAVAILLWQGSQDVLFQEARFFTWVSFITFGGAYAVLSLVADQAVNVYGWLSAEQMVQGLGLAETTPGPLILVTQFVGFLGAYNDPGALDPTFSGILGALTTTYFIFLPCFAFVFLGAPYMELLAANRRIAAALTAVSAAVVGIIANVGVFFAQKILFPTSGGFDVFAAVMASLSFIAMWRFKVSIQALIAVGALLGIVKVML